RSNFGEIGLHRPYLAGAPHPDAEVRSLVSRMFNDVRVYVDELGINTEFATVMLNTPPATMRIYNTVEIHEIVAKSDPTYDELRVSQQARRYGINTDEFRRRHADAERSCTASRLGFPRFMNTDSPEFTAYSSAHY